MATHLTAVRTPDSEATMALPDQIKNLRKEHGWSRADLATRVGADRAALLHILDRILANTRIRAARHNAG